jgi:hypothetical protein
MHTCKMNYFNSNVDKILEYYFFKKYSISIVF